MSLGETLPLFGELRPVVPSTPTNGNVERTSERPVSIRRKSGGQAAGRSHTKTGVTAGSSKAGYTPSGGVSDICVPRVRINGDRNMQVAFQLSQTLKGTGRHSKVYAKLSDDQRHQVGNAICEHLLASLRQQVAAES